MRGGVEFGGGNDASFKDGASRWGIKGSNELSEGLTAVYRFEHKISTSNAGQPSGRLAYLGLSGGFGNLTLSQIGNASYGATGAIVDNSGLYINAYTGGDADGSSRTGNAISYSNSVGGVCVQLDAIMDPKRDSGKSIDEAQLGILMSLGDFGKLGVAHTTTEDWTTYPEMAADLIGNGGGTGATSERAAATTKVLLNSKTGVVTNSEKIVWRNKGKVVDATTAKDVMVTYTIGTTTVMAKKVYTHNDTVLGAGEIMEDSDGNLYASACKQVDSDSTNDCTTGHYVWVSSTVGTETKDGDKDKNLKMTHTVAVNAGDPANSPNTSLRLHCNRKSCYDELRQKKQSNCC